MPIAQAVAADDRVCAADLRETWRLLSQPDRVEGFRLLPRGEAEELFFSVSAPDQAAIVLGVPREERRSWVRLLAPDDAADVIQSAPVAARDQLLAFAFDHLCPPNQMGSANHTPHPESNSRRCPAPRYQNTSIQSAMDAV